MPDTSSQSWKGAICIGIEDIPMASTVAAADVVHLVVPDAAASPAALAVVPDVAGTAASCVFGAAAGMWLLMFLPATAVLLVLVCWAVILAVLLVVLAVPLATHLSHACSIC
jgi:hypothetical protein